MVQWLRICLPMQGTQISRAGKVSHALRQLCPCAATTEPVFSYLGAATTEARVPWGPCATRGATTMRSTTGEWPSTLLN